MADKIDKEESIARVYQFLNQHENWKTEADSNNDGKIIRTEFRSYLLGFDGDSTLHWDGLSSSDKDDLINQFWKSIDTNTTGKVGGGCKASNKNTLDAAEMQNVQKNIEATDIIEKFMRDKEPPAELSEFRNKWKNSVKQGLIYKATQFLKNGSIEELQQSWLDSAYKVSAEKATADYAATSVIDEKLSSIIKYNENTQDEDKYKVKSDKELEKIINAYISSLEGTTKDESTIISEIKKLVEAYADTADTNSSTKILEEYGYDPDGYLNDLQKATLTQKLKDKIIEYIKTNYSDVYTDEYKEQISSSVSEFVKKYLSGRSASEFNELKNFDASSIASSADFTTLVNKIKTEQKELDDAKNELKTYVQGILDQRNTEKTRAVEINIGSSVYSEAERIINSMKSASDIKKAKEDLEKAIRAIDKKLPSNFLDKLPATISSVEGGTFNTINLPNYYGSAYQSGELHYKETSGCSVLSVSDSGTISLNTSSDGQWNASIAVYDDEGNIVSGPKQINIKICKKADLSSQSAMFNGKTMAQIMTSGKDAVQLSSFKIWSNAKVVAKEAIKRYVNSIKSALMGKEGFDASRLEIAATRTLNYYTALIDQVEDRLYSSSEGMQEITISYLDENGEAHAETTTYSQKTREYEKHAGRTNDGAVNIDQTSSGLRMNESYSATNTYEYYLNTAILLRKFEQFYNM